MSFGDNPNQYSGPNPYAVPSGDQFSPTGGPPGGAAASKVKGPAIALLILCPIGILFLCLDIAGRIYGIVTGEVGFLGENAQAAQMQGAVIGNYVGLVFDFLAIIGQAYVGFGAYKMLKLENRQAAYSACVLSVIPCMSACCLLGIPFGIWGIVVMNDPAVKQAFRS
ncbi:MAG: hypothetical protein R3C53_25910 [Pirellulaceae bacterium]